MPLSRRQVYHRRRVVVFGTLAALLVVAFYLPLALLAPLKASSASVVSYSAPITKAADITWPAYGASAIAAVGYDGVLGSAGSTKPLPMASVSKLITALVVLQKKPLGVGEDGPTITMDSSDVAWYNHYLALDGSIEPVRAGEQLTELQLLQVTLIPSANNYASTMAEWAYGSEDAFLAAAHTWMATNGLDDTTFIEPTGIDKKNTSTARDLVHLGELTLESPVLTQVLGTKSAVIPDVGTVTNTNKLLGVDGVTGLKTGTLGKGHANLLFSAKRKVGSTTVTLVGVVLGGVDHDSLDDDIRTMLKGVYSGFHNVTLTTAGVTFGGYTTPWKQKASIVTTKGANLVVWGDTKVTAAVSTTKITTGAAGTKVGKVVFTVGDPQQKATTVAVDLALKTALTAPSAGWRLAHPFG